MRHILASVFLVVLLFPALALGGEIKLEDLVITNGLYFTKFTNIPFTGKVTGREGETREREKGRCLGRVQQGWTCIEGGNLRKR